MKQIGAEAQRPSRVAGLGKPFESRPEIGVFGFEAIGSVFGIFLRARIFFGENEAICSVRASCVWFFAAVAQLFDGVFANRFEHDESRIAGGLFDLLHQTFVHDAGRAVEQIDFEIGFSVADRFDTFEIASTDEDREAAKEFLFGGIRRS